MSLRRRLVLLRHRLRHLHRPSLAALSKAEGVVEAVVEAVVRDVGVEGEEGVEEELEGLLSQLELHSSLAKQLSETNLETRRHREVAPREGAYRHREVEVHQRQWLLPLGPSPERGKNLLSPRCLMTQTRTMGIMMGERGGRRAF
jgi:hypothetical protein